MKAKASPLAVITNLRQFFFKTFQGFSKAFQPWVSKHRIQLSLAVKNLVCFIYFKELLEMGARLIQIKQVLQIVAKLLQITAAPVVTNWRYNYYKSGQFQLFRIGAKLLQIGAVITNWGRIITNRGRYYKLGQLFQIGAEYLEQAVRNFANSY